MKLRTFTAASMPAAMKLVREEMGEDAIIVASEALAHKRAVSVTAAVERKDELPSTARQDKREIDQLRFELQNILRFHNVPDFFLAKIMQKATDAELSACIGLHRAGGHIDDRHLTRLTLEALLGGFFGFRPLDIEDAARLMLVGTPGIGKTLTIAKLATRLTMDKRPLAVITTDNRRAGGIEQLEAFTRILGLDLKVATNKDELADCLEAAGRSRTLIDTAGCNPYDHAELGELESYAALPGVEPVLVMPSAGDALEAIDAAEAFVPLGIRRLLITRADATRRFGGVLATAAAYKLDFCQISNSSSLVDSLHPAGVPMLAQLLLRYQLQS